MKKLYAVKKNLLFCFATILFGFNCFSQVTFENGYFIGENTEKTEALIKNVDWKNNPTSFDYRLNENSEVQTASIENVKEFLVGDQKYIRETVEIDRSSESIYQLSTKRNPDFEEEQLFLKVLIEGDANLYLYEDKNITRYFFSHNNGEVKQLVYKKYNAEGNTVAKNEYYKQQILRDLKCSKISQGDIAYIGYTKRELSRLFNNYNKCKDPNYVERKKAKKDLFNLSVRLGLNSSNLSITEANTDAMDFDNYLSPRISVEAEYILPFNQNKWSVIVEPTFQSYKTEKTMEVDNVSGGQLHGEIDYKSLEVPVGLRHYFFLGNNSKLFLNAAFVFDFAMDSKAEFSRNDGTIYKDFDISSRTNWAIGFGFKFMDKFSLEARYHTGREILDRYVTYTSDYETMSVIFGYTIF